MPDRLEYENGMAPQAHTMTGRTQAIRTLAYRNPGTSFLGPALSRMPALALKPGLALTRRKADAPESERESSGGAGRILVCRACGQAITRPEARTTINGKQIHVFCNPAGVVYEVACFAYAAGLSAEGGVFHEFSWFPGYAWQIVNCARCGEHLGWLFHARSGSGFHGLLPGKLHEILAE